MLSDDEPSMEPVYEESGAPKQVRLLTATSGSDQQALMDKFVKTVAQSSRQGTIES